MPRSSDRGISFITDSDSCSGRDAYRRLKANVVFNIFRHSDNNDIYIAEGQASKYISKTNDAAIDNIIKGYNHVYNTMLKEGPNIYFSIIPDKNYFIAESDGTVVAYDSWEELIAAAEEIEGLQDISGLFDAE